MSVESHTTFVIPPYNILEHPSREAVFTVLTSAFEPETEQTAIQYLRPMADSFFVVAQNAQAEPVGVGVLGTFTWRAHGSRGPETRINLQHIGVLPAEHNKDIGTAIMQACEVVGRTEGAQYLTLAPNKGVAVFYEKCGYTPNPEIPEEYLKRLS